MALLSKMLVLSGVAATLCSLSAAQASVVYSENFNSYGDGTQLTSPTFGATAMSGAGTNPLTINGGAVSLTTSGEDDMWSVTGSPISSGSVYYHATINVAAAKTAGDYVMGLGFSTSNSFYYARLFIKASDTGYVIGINPGSIAANTVWGSTVYSFGSNVDIVGAYTFVDGANNDTSSLYASTDGVTYATLADTATNATAIDATSISTIFLRQGSSSAAPTLTIDNLIVGTSLEDVTGVGAPVPEPATIGALGLGGLMLLTRRRKA